jgi:hypothetical protein
MADSTKESLHGKNIKSYFEQAKIAVLPHEKKSVLTGLISALFHNKLKTLAAEKTGQAKAAPSTLKHS